MNSVRIREYVTRFHAEDTTFHTTHYRKHHDFFMRSHRSIGACDNILSLNYEHFRRVIQWKQDYEMDINLYTRFEKWFIELGVCDETFYNNFLLCTFSVGYGHFSIHVLLRHVLMWSRPRPYS